MAKKGKSTRSSSVSGGRRGGGKQLSKSTVIIIFVIAVVCYLLYNYYLQKYETQPEQTNTESAAPTQEVEKGIAKPSVEQEKPRVSNETTTLGEDVKLNYRVTQPAPVGKNQIVEHKSFVLSYNEKHEQADWVYYLLTKEMINGDVERTDDFREDEHVTTGSALKADYTRSGYDRGHLCPSADVRHDLEAQSETFYMSNMSPQLPGLNRGVWKELEEQTRDYTLKHDSVYIVTGPVLTDGLKTIGRENKVSVPQYYYKILYSTKDGGQILAYLLENAKLKGEPNDYIVTVDEIEKMSGLDFFPEIRDEENLEGAQGDIQWWAN